MLFSVVCRTFLDTHKGADYENDFQKFYDMMRDNEVFSTINNKDLDLEFLDFDIKCDEKKVRSAMVDVWLSNCCENNLYAQLIKKITYSPMNGTQARTMYTNETLIKIVDAAQMYNFEGFKEGCYYRDGIIHTAYKQAVIEEDTKTINKALAKIKDEKPEEVKIDKTPESPQNIKKELEAVKIIETMRQEIVDLRAQVVAANQKRSQETSDHFSKLDKIVESVVAENEALKTKLKEAEAKLTQAATRIEAFKTQFAPLAEMEF